MMIFPVIVIAVFLTTAETKHAAKISKRQAETTVSTSNERVGCGFRGTTNQQSNTSGDTNFGEFPWTVAIFEEIAGSSATYLCGGSLLHPKVVLTAAHCVHKKPIESLKIRVGEWDFNSETETPPHQERNVASIELHDHFYRGALFNDVALLNLAEAVTIGDNVQTICLPPENFTFDASKCFVTGWTKEQLTQPGQGIQKRVPATVTTKPDCVNALRSTSLGAGFELHHSFICARGDDPNASRGQGGSPLVCPIPGTDQRYYQAGIAAWGVKGQGNPPEVYVQVAKLRYWIDEMLEYARIDARTLGP